jgi:hypothetical protein
LHISLALFSLPTLLFPQTEESGLSNGQIPNN